MIPKEAIEKAKEGGFRIRERHVDVGLSELSTNLCDAEIALDPTFWQALGKALGWVQYTGVHEEMDILCPCNPDKIVEDGYTMVVHQGKRWETEAHNFYGNVLRGMNTEAFWKDLLSTPSSK